MSRFGTPENANSSAETLHLPGFSANSLLQITGNFGRLTREFFEVHRGVRNAVGMLIAVSNQSLHIFFSDLKVGTVDCSWYLISIEKNCDAVNVDAPTHDGSGLACEPRAASFAKRA